MKFAMNSPAVSVTVTSPRPTCETPRAAYRMASASDMNFPTETRDADAEP